MPEPWTDDEILLRYRFCNAFRASDRVSQYLIRDVIYSPTSLEEGDRILRTILFRLFSKPSTWELIEEQCGTVTVNAFDPEHIGLVLDDAMQAGRTLYTSAFILCANRAYGHARKHRNHLALLAAMLKDRLPERILEAQSLQQVFLALRAFPLIGPFMAYQLAIDLNYGPDLAFGEDDFTVPGPGAVRGLAKVFENLGDHSPQSAVHWLVEQQATISDELGIAPPRLYGRPLHAIDCQNLLCELDKYARVKFPHLRSDRRRIKQAFAPAGELPEPFFPPRWALRPAHLRRHDTDVRSGSSAERASRRSRTPTSKNAPPATTSSSPGSRSAAVAM
jgi:alpha-glutamyl/putrescinyl thymine pyrophosphorylase clade 1